MAARRKMRGRRLRRRAKILLLALFFLVCFEGKLPVSGSQAFYEQPEGSRATAIASKGREGAKAGQGMPDARRRELEERARIADLEAARTGREFVLRRDFQTALMERRFAAAELALSALEALRPTTSWFPTEDAQGKTQGDAAALALFDSVLPLTLGPGRKVYQRRGSRVLLRVESEGGGFRYPRADLAKLDPKALRSAVLGAGLELSDARRVLDTLASFFLQKERRVAAILLREGRFRLPPAAPGFGR